LHSWSSSWCFSCVPAVSSARSAMSAFSAFERLGLRQMQACGSRRALLGLAMAVALLPLAVGSDFHFRVLAVVWIFALGAVGLNILMGHAGVVSLGHAGFVAIGAYAVALAPRFLGGSSWWALALGAVVTAA